MKKTYSKPEIVFESFAMSTNLANDCEYKPKDEELFFEGAGFVFLEVCEWPVLNVGGDSEWNGICYHVMTTNAPNVFNS